MGTEESMASEEVKLPKGVNKRDTKSANRYFKCLVRMGRYVAKVSKRHPELGGEDKVRILFETATSPEDVLKGIKDANKEAIKAIVASSQEE